MKGFKSLFEPAISFTYLHLMIDIMAEHECSVESLLENTGLTIHNLDQINHKMSAFQWATIVTNALRHYGSGGLGCEYGLRMQPSTHGLLGFAAISGPSIQAALDLLMRYFSSRQYNLELNLVVKEQTHSLEIIPKTKFSMGEPGHAVRCFMFEALLIGLAKGVDVMLGRHDFSGLSLSFDYPRPDYFDEYEARLPKAFFNQHACAIHIPSHILMLRPRMANLEAVQQAVELCEIEKQLLNPYDKCMNIKVRALLTQDSSLNKEKVANALKVSSRHLARVLQSEGYLFSELKEEALKRDAIHLIQHSQLDIQDIAYKLGYINPANFTRVFRKWTSVTPSKFRAQAAESVLNSKLSPILMDPSPELSSSPELSVSATMNPSSALHQEL